MTLTCLHFCTSEAWGGLELYACTLMVKLKEAGCTVIGVTRPHSKAAAFLQSHGVEAIRVPGYSAVSIESIRLLRSLISARRVDVVHVHFHRDIWQASLSLRSDTRRKLFLSIYMGVPKKTDPFHRFIYKRVDAIFTSSVEMNNRLPALYPVPASRVHLLPYGRAIDTYRRDDARRSEIRAFYGVRPEETLVGTIVRIDPGKGAMDFARSYSYIAPDVRPRYLIVGEPTRRAHARPDESPFEKHCEAYRREMEAYIAAEGLGEKILLAGFQDDLVGYLSAIDVFVFPSRDELYYLVMLDAMCMGLPVVAARAGGNPSQIEDGVSGLLYSVADSRDLADKVMRYLRSIPLRHEHGRAARMFVEKQHDMNDTISRLLEFYRGKAGSSLPS